MDTNVLYYGDNLDILRKKYITGESIDLIYLDPPFNSNRDYNILFKENGGLESEAQTHAFTDTWHWTQTAYDTYQDIVLNGPDKVSRLISALHDSIGNNDVMAYLVMMTVRLVELHRVLKPTGSLYLHCDPTASHYLKIVLDQIFGPANFRNEIVWRRTATHGKSKRNAPIHDIIFFYSKGEKYKWTYLKKPYMKGHVEEYFVKDDTGWRTNYYGNVLTGSGLRGGESGKPWKGFDPSAKGRHWAIPGALLDDIDEDLSSLTQHQKLDHLFELGYIKIVEGQAWPVYERHISPQDGQNIPDIWAYQPYTNGTVFGSNAGIDEDVRWLSPQDQERLGYDTQKPLALLERIIKASSDEGDIVLDPFCGCGTAVVAAQKLNRKWIGIDITHLAINVMKRRLKDSFGVKPMVVGEPKDLAGAKELASQKDKYQFQWWALDLIDAHPAGEKKKGADKGVDGVIPFIDNTAGKLSRVIIQVKSGHVGVDVIKNLDTTIKNEAIGVLITLEPPTEPMKVQAIEAGYYHSALYDKDYPKIQILTIEELFQGKKVDMPPQQQTSVAFAKAPKVAKKQGKQLAMG